MSDDHIDDAPAHDRRQFFTRSFGRLLRPLAGYIEKKLPIELPDALSGERELFRPPGAVAAAEFLRRCYRCGSCADECPVGAIELIQGMHEKIDGTPRLDPNRRACIVCEDLACMKVCPSGALQLVDRLKIRIGLAQIDQTACVRSEGETCTTCIETCPIGEDAIRLTERGDVEIIAPGAKRDGSQGEEPRGVTDAENPDATRDEGTDPADKTETGCVGCGVCVGHCPAKPGPALRVNVA